MWQVVQRGSTLVCTALQLPFAAFDAPIMSVALELPPAFDAVTTTASATEDPLTVPLITPVEAFKLTPAGRMPVIV
jgi:hypothetical protein